MAEIQTLTDPSSWRYVDSPRNPAEHITKGLTLKELMCHHQWGFGPTFLSEPPDQWPAMPGTAAEPDQNDLRRSAFIGVAKLLPSLYLSDASQSPTWRELVQATVQSCHRAATPDSPSEASDFIDAEIALLVHAQTDSFPAEVKALKALHPVSSESRLGSQAPEFEQEIGLIRVGGRLRCAADLDAGTIHPIVLDSGHPL